MNNKHSTTSAYQEPSNFNGSEGEWVADGYHVKVERHGNTTIARCFQQYSTQRCYKQSEADAALIAQSKEAIKGLQQFVEAAKGALNVFRNEANYPEGTWGYRIAKELQSATDFAANTLIKAGLNQ